MSYHRLGLYVFSWLMALALFFTAPLAQAQAFSALPAESRALLAPLEATWSELSAEEQSQWAKLVAQFKSAPPEKQARIKSRIKKWANLSPAQRAKARENFKALQGKAPGERNSTWNSYQALEPQQRDALQNSGSTPSSPEQNPLVPPGAAAYTR